MSRFQATISTFAAIGTIALTVVTVYRFVDNQRQNELQNQKEIQTLREQLNQQLLDRPFESEPEGPTPTPRESARPSLGSGGSSEPAQSPPPVFKPSVIQPLDPTPDPPPVNSGP